LEGKLTGETPHEISAEFGDRTGMTMGPGAARNFRGPTPPTRTPAWAWSRVVDSETCIGRPKLIQKPMFQMQDVPIRDRSEYPIVVVGDRDGPESVSQEKVRRFL
jgi:hypothetical protein